MELINAIRERRSIRRFLDKPVPKDLLEKILRECTWASSSMNTQPWYFYVVTGETREKIVEICNSSFNFLEERLRELFSDRHVEFVR